MNRENRYRNIEATARIILDNGATKDPDFYLSKQVMRVMSDNAPLIEIDTNSILVIDHDMTEHRF